MLTPIKQLPPSLAPGHRAFAEALIEGKPRKEAAIRAGYSRRSASLQAHRLLKRDDIRRYIEFRREEMTNQDASTAVALTESFRRIAMLRPMDLLVVEFDEAGNQRVRWKWPDELTDEEKDIIADIELSTFRDQETGQMRQSVRYKFENSKIARDSLVRILGVSQDGVDILATVKGQTLFEFVVCHEETSETHCPIMTRQDSGGARGGKS